MLLYRRVDPRTGRSNNIWYYDLTPPGGKRQRISTKTKIKAEAKDIMAAAHGAAKLPQVKRITIAEAIKGYIEDLTAQRKPWATEAAKLRDRTFSLGGYVGRPVVIDPSMTVDQISEEIVNRLKIARLEGGLGVHSVAH